MGEFLVSSSWKTPNRNIMSLALTMNAVSVILYDFG
jgi:hypothetical protein